MLLRPDQLNADRDPQWPIKLLPQPERSVAGTVRPFIVIEGVVALC
jgi:hypothetical protein